MLDTLQFGRVKLAALFGTIKVFHDNMGEGQSERNATRVGISHWGGCQID